MTVRYIKPCSVAGCHRTAVSFGWCGTHYERWRKHGDVSVVTTRPAGTGSIGTSGYLHFRANGELVIAHIRVAELALGKPLPEGAEVHHVDENKLNNANTNLVICPSRAYHILLHQRQRALDACGNANWRTCNVCHQYDDPANLRIGKRSSAHPVCCREYYKQWRNAVPDYLMKVTTKIHGGSTEEVITERLIRARNEARAVAHVVADTVQISRAEVDDVIRLTKAGIALEVAAE